MSESTRPFMLKKSDGTVLIMRILHPTNTPDDEMLKWTDVQKAGIISWAEVKEEDLPQDRVFREAWKHEDGVGVHENLDLAKQIRLNEFRQIRAPLFSKLDIDLMKASEAGLDTTEIKTKKQTLRDVTKVTLPDEVEQLKTFIPSCLTGEV